MNEAGGEGFWLKLTGEVKGVLEYPGYWEKASVGRLKGSFPVQGCLLLLLRGYRREEVFWLLPSLVRLVVVDLAKIKPP